jgi:hypothetical protein
MRGLKDVMLSPRAQAAVRLALAEDLVSVDEVRSSRRLDATSVALVDPKAVATGEIYSKGTGCVVSGTTVAAAVFKAVDPSVKVKILRRDGSSVKPGEPILVFRGKARSILAAERTALNFMQRMCATATLAGKFVEATRRYGTLILDTRKTTPGLRVFEKYAVTCGGVDILANVEECLTLLRNSYVEWELRTTCCKPFHDTEALEAIGKWLSGTKNYYLQAFVDSGDLVGSGVSGFTKEEMEALQRCVLPYIPTTRIRGI